MAFNTETITSLEHIASGKVREIYRIDDKRLLFVASDRLSAFDVIMPTQIPNKGHILTQIAEFWFEKTRHIIPNHLLSTDISNLPLNPGEKECLQGRSMIVRDLKVLPVEAIVRGYLVGSGWKEYQQTQSVCNIPLPAGLKMADKLLEDLFTPSTKAVAGEHDENISFEILVDQIGQQRAVEIRDASLALYRFAAEFALQRGIIIADTKFEFGQDEQGRLFLIDEALTPDSSRFWPVASYQPGSSPESFDKQYIRDWLENTGWEKIPPAPAIPDDIVRQTQEKYNEALTRLTINGEQKRA
ncbi:MAG: phosphoribosylaminoimidazolesuccinocarboxamide synthase [Gammaproteobacteria bacterium]|nr:phosphoribosylaminoimidazolesuccinocarboxamide synthase [Gammaproteobacteria bacterium]